MVFTLTEIKNYLLSKENLSDAIDDLSAENIVSIIEDMASLNFIKNEQNKDKYEASIGLHRLKEEQKAIYRNTNGKSGKYWMALSPKWLFSNDEKKRFKTKFEISYWVNYGDDETYGWFSVEEIKEWLTNQDLKLKTLQDKRIK